MQQPNVAQLAAVHASGARWFNWVAGLSLVNSLLFIFGEKWHFCIGLAFTDVVNAVLIELSGGSVIAKVVAFVIDALFAGVFAGLGWLALRRQHWAYIVGLVLLCIDGALCALCQDWMSTAFHGWAAFAIYNGLRASMSLGKLVPAGATAAAAAAQSESQDPSAST